MLDWNWEKNNALGFDPEKLTCGSNKTVWWKCHVCGNEWTTRIHRKTNGAQCKKCIAKQLTIANKRNSLATLYPKIAAEWDYDLNDTTPDKVFPQSNLSYHWVCSKGHKWEDSASHRISRDNICPICSGRRIVEGINDLATTNKELLEEWDYEENNKKGIFPNKISYGSKKPVSWICKRGHKWNTPPYVRTTGHENCPQCSKETHTSYPEKAIAYYVKKEFPNSIENYRAKELGKYEIDIYIPDLNIGIEYDGSRWHRKADNDYKKDLVCQKLGIQLFRIREIGCCEYDSGSIKIYIKKKDDKELAKAINKLFSLLNGKYTLALAPDIDIDRDGLEILSHALSVVKENSIANSPLIKEWNEKRNKNIDPSLIPIFSNRRNIWWICSKGHEWRTSPAKRSIGRGCPECARERSRKR